jgi:hypothetical protein
MMQGYNSLLASSILLRDSNFYLCLLKPNCCAVGEEVDAILHPSQVGNITFHNDFG